MNPPELGKYRHFKGNEYEVVGIALHSETREQLVLYRALHGEPHYWARPLESFLATVERDGRRFARFERID